MVSIEDRLRELGYSPKRDGSPQRSHKVTAGKSLSQTISGEWHYNKYGGVYIVNKSLDIDDLLSYSDEPSELSVFKNYIGYTQKSITLDDLVFIDIETTGLASDAGTYVFLIGLGKYTGTKLNLTQFFLNSPAGELALLDQLEKHLTDSSVIVSYNGKSFDVPHIRSRYLYFDWPNPLEDHHHIDLLHLVRRIWKARLSNRSLGQIETKILNVRRSEEDIPGWMVAQLYLEYLHTQDASPLTRIFYHNEIDVISLAMLLDHIARILSNPLDVDIEHGLDLISIGKLYADMGDLSYSVKIYKRGLEFDDVNGSQYQNAIIDLAYILKKQNLFDQANELWEMAASWGDIDACIELAKYFEHRNKKLENAIEWTEKALQFVQSDQLMPYQRTLVKPELDHRLNRLLTKITRSQENAE